MESTIIKSTGKRSRRSSAEMYPVVEQYLASNQGREDFCRDAGVSVSTLSYWVSKYHRDLGRDAGTSFVPIHLSASSSVGVVMELEVGGGLIRFYSYPDPAYVCSLIEQGC